MRTFFGNLLFGSLTFTKANWMRPSEKSSTRSANSPSKQDSCQCICKHGAVNTSPLTAGALDLEDTLLSAVLLESAHQRRCDSIKSPLAVCLRAGGSTRRWCSVNHGLVSLCNLRTIGRTVQSSHGLDSQSLQSSTGVDQTARYSRIKT